MTEVLCDIVECHLNSGGLRSSCTREVLRLDPEPKGSRRIFIPRTIALRCMDVDERPALGSTDEWPRLAKVITVEKGVSV